jgi:hypothetical protein
MVGLPNPYRTSLHFGFCPLQRTKLMRSNLAASLGTRIDSLVKKFSESNIRHCDCRRPLVFWEPQNLKKPTALFLLLSEELSLLILD